MTNRAMDPNILPPGEEALEAAIGALRVGQPVIVPTDTVYGLAVRAGDADAIDQVFVLKRRPADRSIAVLVGDVDQASELATLNDVERRLVARCWPGALTLVLTRRLEVDPSIGRDDGTVGLRCPDNAFVRRLALAVGPLATTSANRSGDPTPTTAAAAAASLDGPVAVVVDGGPLEAAASTVARVEADRTITVFREGIHTHADLTHIATNP